VLNSAQCSTGAADATLAPAVKWQRALLQSPSPAHALPVSQRKPAGRQHLADDPPAAAAEVADVDPDRDVEPLREFRAVQCSLERFRTAELF
jgi:hypothetical protein